ncbi:MAG: class I SAM-dependent RNA methyltransferase [Chloroflexota bacterium]
MDTYELTLTTFTYGGDCLGRIPDGRACFVPYALPGEHVRVRIVEEKRGHVRAELLAVLEPSAERISPRCPHHFALSHHQAATERWCGGCHYQHLPYAAQLQAKTGILRDQLERIGRIANPVLQPIVASPQAWNYRNYIQFHLSEEGRLGFEGKALDGSTGILPIRECHLPEETINATWPQLDLAPTPGLARIGLRLSGDDDVLLLLESAEALEFDVENLPVSAVQIGPAGSMVLAGSDYFFIDVLDRSFRVSAESFFQVNTPLAAAMVEHVLANLPLTPATTLLDAYCGVGLFSAFLAPRVARLIGVELSPSACDDFSSNLDEFDNVDLYQAAAEEVLPALEVRPDIVLVDPPRAGLAPRARQAILAMAPTHIAYISCDPATLARDARHISESGYRLRQITPFDLFPQTYHIESISFWER